MVRRRERGSQLNTCLRGQGQDDIVFTVATRKSKVIFGFIVDDVGSDLAIVCVYRSLDEDSLVSETRGVVVVVTYNPDGVIMIPNCAGILEIGIKVVLVLAGLGQVVCPSVERRTLESLAHVGYRGWASMRGVGLLEPYRVTAVQMDGARETAVVCEPDHTLGPLLFPEHRARNHSVVTDEGGRREVGVNLLGEFLDLDLVVPDLVASYGIVDGPVGPGNIVRLLE